MILLAQLLCWISFHTYHVCLLILFWKGLFRNATSLKIYIYILTLEYFLPYRHISEMATSDSIWISLLFEQRPPCIIDPAVYGSGCTYGMESQPGFETACVLCRHSGSLRNWTSFMEVVHGFWRCPIFLYPEEITQHWGWETARWGTGSNNFSYINTVGKKAAFASFFEQ